MRIPAALAILCTAAIIAACNQNRPPRVDPAGAETSLKTDALKAGAKVLQANAPVAGMDVYLVGFHPMKNDPSHQMEAHHYCRQVNEDFAQCALFDSNTERANLNGIEYIISRKLFDALPEGERKYWHPHNGEILSGQLVAPGLPDAAEKELMRSKMNSYGKTWHTWSTSRGDRLPTGDPILAWSFNRDGEADPQMVEKRDRAIGVVTEEKRNQRRDLVDLAQPQSGVDALKGKFARPTQDIPGVVDAGNSIPDADASLFGGAHGSPTTSGHACDPAAHAKDAVPFRRVYTLTGLAVLPDQKCRS